MKNLIKSALCAAAVLTLTSVGAYAETIIVPTVDANNNVTVTVETDSKKDNIYGFRVYDPSGKDYKLEMVVGADGAQISFKVKDSDPRGAYKIIAGGGELRGETKKFAIANDTDRTAAFSAISAAAAGNAESVLKQYDDKVWSIDFDNKYYTSNMTNVMTSFVNYLPKTLTCSADVETAFRQACTLSEIQQASANEAATLLDKRGELLGAEFTDILLGKDEKTSEEDKKAINAAFVNLAKDESRNPLNSTEQLQTLATRAEALGMMNSATRENCFDRLKKYAGDLGVTVSSDVDKFELVKQLVNANAAANDTSIENFQKRYGVAVDKVKEIAQIKPEIMGSGNNKGGGGGSSSVKIDNNLAPQNVAVAAETLSEDNGVFSDVPKDGWARKYIEYIAAKEIMTGDGDGTFRPEDSITREEFLKTVICGLNLDTNITIAEGRGLFDDVEKDDWFYPYVRFAAAEGIINGIDENNFGAGTAISRQDAAVIIMRFKEYCTLPFSDEAEKLEFTDKKEIADYAAVAVEKLQVSGILNGDENGAYRPLDNVSRAETAKIIYSVLKNIKSL